MRGMMKIMIKQTITAIIGTAALAGCTTPSGTTQATGGETLTYTVYSWGQPEQYWQVGPDGKGEIRLYSDAQPRHPPKVERYHIDVTPEGYEGVRSELADFISGKIRKIPCKDLMTDQPAGSLKWTGGKKDGEIFFNYGCQGDKEMKIFSKFQNAGLALREMMVRDEQPFEVIEPGS